MVDELYCIKKDRNLYKISIKLIYDSFYLSKKWYVIYFCYTYTYTYWNIIVTVMVIVNKSVNIR